MQSPSAAQLVLHAPAAQTYGEQSTPLVATHVPVPLQRRPLALLPLHVVAPHATVCGALARHAPLPSHLPSPLQLAGKPGSGVQAARGFVLATTLPHAPSAPWPFSAAEQATHAPAHAVSQQTPSTQLLVVQS